MVSSSHRQPEQGRGRLGVALRQFANPCAVLPNFGCGCKFSTFKVQREKGVLMYTFIVFIKAKHAMCTVER